jgi:hypothetical protein
MTAPPGEVKSALPLESEFGVFEAPLEDYDVVELTRFARPPDAGPGGVRRLFRCASARRRVTRHWRVTLTPVHHPWAVCREAAGHRSF